MSGIARGIIASPSFVCGAAPGWRDLPRQIPLESRAARGNIEVPLGPRLVSPKTESAAFAGGLPELLAGKAENAKRRRASPPAFPGNPFGVLFRFFCESSPNVALLEHFRERRARVFVSTFCAATSYGDNVACHVFSGRTARDCQNGITESRGVLTRSRRKN